MADITLALTGVTTTNVVYGDSSYSTEWWITDSVGDVTPRLSYTLSGNAGTGQVGTVGTSAAVSIGITGNTGTLSTGSVFNQTALTRALTGIYGTGQVGSLTLNVTYTAQGNSAIGQTGTVGTTSTSTKAITGNTTPGQVGNIIAARTTFQAITGVSGTGQVGSVTKSIGYEVALSGVSSVVVLGDIENDKPIGAIEEFVILDGGSGYHPSSTITIAPPKNPLGKQATASLVIENGAITGITIEEEGSLYENTPSVTIFGRNSTPMKIGTAQLRTGGVASVNILDGGSMYAETPTLTFSAPHVGGKTAKGYAIMNGPVISNVIITDPGSGYLRPPEVTVTGHGIGQANLVATLSANAYKASGVTDFFNPRNTTLTPFDENEVGTVAYTATAISGTITAIEVSPASALVASEILGGTATIHFKTPENYYPWIVKYYSVSSGEYGEVTSSFKIPDGSVVYEYNRGYEPLEFEITIYGNNGTDFVSTYFVEVRPDYSSGTNLFQELVNQE